MTKTVKATIKTDSKKLEKIIEEETKKGEAGLRERVLARTGECIAIVGPGGETTRIDVRMINRDGKKM